jgi:APA family basic amino acid/polyamine antiporter
VAAAPKVDLKSAAPELAREIRRWDVVAVAINGVIGAGIFGLPSRVFALIGPWSIAAFLACAIVVGCIVVCFAEVGSRFRATGGPLLYGREAFGPVLGFQVGWLNWLARLTAFAANGNLFVSYLSFFVPGASAAGWRELTIVVVAAALTAVNVVGVKNATRVSNIFTVGKLLPIILFVAVGLFFLERDRFTTPAAIGYSAFSTSVLTMIYAFTGFEMAAIPAGEIRDPQRDLPRGLLMAIAIVAVLYVGIQVVCVGTLPGLATSTRPVADAATAFAGRAGASLITAGVLVSIIGNLNILILSGSRLIYAMGEAGDIPRVAAVTHTKFRTPYVAILATAGLMTGLALASSFVKQVNVSVIARLVSYGVTCAALIVFRRRPDAPAAPFLAPSGVALAAVTMLAILWLLTNATVADIRDTSIAAGIGLLIYGGHRLMTRPRANRPL